MARRLIVNADDLGYTPGVTRGIINAHRTGIVTSTSVMVNMPAARESIELTLQEAPFLGLGLHLTLTAGAPVLPPGEVSDLLDPDDQFLNRHALATRLDLVNYNQIRAELWAQADLFYQWVGRWPDHLDSHHHMTYVHPQMLEAMLDLARELGVPIRRPFSDDRSSTTPFLVEMGIVADQPMGEARVNELASLMSQSQIPMPDRFISDFYGSHVALGDLLNYLVDIAESVTELMCHPAEMDDQLRRMSGYVEPREIELVSLTHPSVKELLVSRGVDLIGFGAIRS